jgi:hypothetical protein
MPQMAERPAAVADGAMIGEDLPQRPRPDRAASMKPASSMRCFAFCTAIY